ncbi:MAG: cytochrome C [Gammaproteobacteria bacterium]|nr:MAG: cytochrome C [Gammaproteobacteria bacterium]
MYLRPGWLLLLFLLMPMISEAGFMDKLIMPGKVSQAHVEFEDKCESCHQKLKKANQVKLCVGCHDHKNIAEDLKTRRGLHGRSNKIQKADCKACHTEHVGRRGDILNFDRDAFDHKGTDFDLKGRHKNVACESCHAKDKKYHEAKHKCVACHKQDDVHKGKLGKKCESCHREQGWKKSKFDHDKKTDFPLVGKHKKVDCDLCHVDARYKKTPDKCVACHKANDIHNNKHGKKCDRCHVPKGWKKTRFKHDPKKYKLKGQHDRASCMACHKADKFDDKVSNACFSCHKVDDVHKTRFGKKCGDCHGQENWDKQHFDHDKDTKFKLLGEHKDVKCDACHRGVIKTEKLGKNCYFCHKQDDVHKKQEGKQCENCHSEYGWKKKVELDHDQTRFPLMGQHSILACESCHEDNQYKDLSIRCISCHLEDDVHKKGMGEKCALCHTPNDWRIWRFDHNRNTDFVIDGKHKDLDCKACHLPKARTMKIPQKCRSCHRADDIHHGSFGRSCGKCHTTKSFSDIKELR